ncbi:MAG: mechanosensitive ion channel family protein [Paludibacteraceae bacterium]
MLDQVYYGNSLKQWLISIIIILGSFLIAKLVLSINKKLIFKLTKRTDTRLDDILFRTLQSPILFGIILISLRIALSRLDLGAKPEKYITEAYKVLITLNVTWFFKCLFNALIVEYLTPKENETSSSKKHYLDEHKISLLQRTTTGVVWTIGIVLGLSNIGVNLGALLGTLGIGGVAFALAAQDTIKNIFGGFTIFTDGTFRIGDRIKVDQYDGHVEDIGIRSTRIRTLEKRLAIIPNYKIVDGAVENVSEEPMFRVKQNLGLVYNTSTSQMKKALSILKEIASNNPGVAPGSAIAAFSNFGDFSLNITFIYYVKKGEDALLVPSSINMEILERFTTERLDFAFPTQTLYMEKDAEIKKQ